MKKRLAVIICLIIALAALPLLACNGGGTPPQLSTPKELNITDGLLSWTAVENAVGYTVKVSDGTTATDMDNGDLTVFDLDGLAEGQYIFSVQARGDGTNYTDSSWSTPKSHYWEEPGDGTKAQKLETPSNLSIADGVLSWKSVGGADGYNIKITDDSGDFTIQFRLQNTLDLSQLDVGEYTFNVMALGDGDLYTDSNWSGEYRHAITASA